MAMTKEAPREFVVWLQTQMDDKGWGVSETARKAGISHTPISYILNNGDQPTFETCKGLAQAFDIPITTVLAMAGLIEKPPERTQELDEWMLLFDRLRDEDKDEMLAMARLKATRRVRGELAKT